MTLYPHLQNHLFGYGGFGIPDDDCIEIIRAFGGIPLVPTYRLSVQNAWLLRAAIEAISTAFKSTSKRTVGLT